MRSFLVRAASASIHHLMRARSEASLVKAEGLDTYVEVMMTAQLY